MELKNLLHLLTSFCSKFNLISKTGVELSIFEKCHNYLIYDITDIKVSLLSPFLTEVWDYKNTNVNHIKCAILSTDWEFIFRGGNVFKKVDILNDCLKTFSTILLYSEQDNKMQLQETALDD